MRIEEEIYLVEKEHQEKAGMPACRCSNCKPEACKLLSTKSKWLTVSNFDTSLENPETLNHLDPEKSQGNDSGFKLNNINMFEQSMVIEKNNRPASQRLELIPLAELLSRTFEIHYQELMNNEERLQASDYLEEDDIWRILNKIHTIEIQEDVFNILGCDILQGGVVKLFDCIQFWRADSVGVEAMEKLRAREAETRLLQAETLNRPQKQHDQQSMKIIAEQTRKSNKRKEQVCNRLAQTLAKRQRKEFMDNKQLAKETSELNKQANHARNGRLMQGLHDGKTM